MSRAFPFILLVAVGCAGPAQERVDALKRTTSRARERGAYRCAPEALARAESRTEFAQVELRGGELIRAEAQLNLAEVAAAFALRNAESCLTSAPLPDAPAPKPIGDRDHDGIRDDVDKCPDEPEDKDGWQDEDGCPDPDNDGDGVLDADDRCPNEAGSAAAHGCPDRDNDGVADTDDKCPDEPGVPENAGCPAPKLIVIHDDKIELKQKIHFQTGKATILPDSNPLLTEIAAVLRRKDVHVRIEGHTDSRGSAQLNTKLSRARADAVRQWLVGAGIAADRLESVGYGPTQPIADNRTASGREENRRVEFFLLTPGK